MNWKYYAIANGLNKCFKEFRKQRRIIESRKPIQQRIMEELYREEDKQFLKIFNTSIRTL